MELESGIFGNNQDKRSARGAALPYGGVSGRDERQSRLGAKSIMQSAVTNGAVSRAHRILDVFESLRDLNKAVTRDACPYRLSANCYRLTANLRS